MRLFSAAIVALSAALAVSAKQVVVTVGGNTTTNATLVFQPAEIFADPNDVVVFNFTLGNHTVTQSVFEAPCVPAHDHNITLNGFDSGFRDTVNGTAITILSVPITPDLVNTTIWFFDFNTCAQGGVGGININDSSTETLAGFIRNAIRLNGTGGGGSSSSIPTHTGSSSTSNPTGGSSSSNSAISIQHSQIVLSALSVIPLIGAAFFL